MPTTALITGGASGIGRALAQCLVHRDVAVVLADRQHELAEQVATELSAAGGRARAVALDVCDPKAFAAVAHDVQEREGSLDYLFNNAGIAVGGEIADYDLPDWNDVLDVNLRGVAHGVQAVYGIMRKQGSGHIINTASVAGLLPTPGEGSYAASKAGVVALSKALRIEAARYGIRVSALCPGVIRTPILTGGVYGGFAGDHRPSDERILAFWERMRPMDPNAFAREAMKGVDANEPIIIVPRWWKAVWMIERLAPKLALWLHAREYGSVLELLQHADRKERGEGGPLEVS